MAAEIDQRIIEIQREYLDFLDDGVSRNIRTDHVNNLQKSHPQNNSLDVVFAWCIKW